jgi:rare lipoprotein A
VIAGRARAAPAGLAMAALAACVSAPPPREPTPEVTPPPVLTAPPVLTPPAPDSVADAIPRVEPRSRGGNPPFYDVFGKRYYVLSSSSGYWERGVASWYGPGFHKVRTSTGESYDMYAMTAAHKTLPLPAYARVTNLQNGRSVVVRVNDRGPFVGNRIIDLSYTAAAKLDMLRNGTAMVEVRTIDPAAPAPLSASSADVPAANPALFVQAGAFSDPANARRMADKLRGGSYGNVFVRDDQIAGRRMYRVRIGPVRDVAEFDRVIAALEQVGISDAHLALN